MKNLFLILACMLTILFRSLAQTLSPEQMKEDLQIFRDGLERFHPEMYRYTDKDSFQKIFENIESQLDAPMDQREFYKTMRPALAALRDGHAKWIVKGKDQHYGFFESELFPLRLYFEDEKVKILGHFGDENVSQLAEIQSINGKPISQIKAELMRSMTFGDGFSQGGKKYQLNRYFSAYFATEYGVKNTYEVTFLDKGKLVNWSGKGVEKSLIEKTFKSEDIPFSFQMTNGWTGILKINRFFSYKHEPNFKRFLKNSFESLKDANISNLILDLRGNEGGFEKLGIELYKYLAPDQFEYYDYVSTRKNQKPTYHSHTSKIFRFLNTFSREKNGIYQFTKAPGLKTYQPKKARFEGNLIVLLDGQSFSVTTEFISRLKSDRPVQIIGEETAGGAALNSSGFFTIITLPNSNIDLGIPRLGFHMANLDPSIPKDRGIQPDHVLVPSAEDLLSGKDPVMEKALNLVVRPSL